MSKRQYSEAEKGAALALVDFHEGNTRHASKLLGIPHTTLQDWVKMRGTNAQVAEIRTEKKEEIATLIETAVRELIAASAGKGTDANLQQLWTSIGIAVDKRQLLRGEATSITKDATARTNEERAARILSIVKPTGT